MNRKAPVILKVQWASAVRFASRLWPIHANSAVIVVPMLSPRRTGMAPARPMMLETPSGPACAAKFCRTAMVALLLCTTRVISVPTSTPSTGIPETWSIILTKTGLAASGFITLLMICMPSNSSPNAKIVWPMLLIFSDLKTKDTIKPTKIMTKI